MSKQDPFALPSGWRRLSTLRGALSRGETGPKTGVTQGGSSREFAGAKPAATNGLARPKKPGEKT